MDVVIGARRKTYDDGGRLLCDRAPELCEYGGDNERPQEHSTSLHGRVPVLQCRGLFRNERPDDTVRAVAPRACYSITSSARNRIDGGTARPSDFDARPRVVIQFDRNVL
jgi:hypothetical protein